MLITLGNLKRLIKEAKADAHDFVGHAPALTKPSRIKEGDPFWFDGEWDEVVDVYDGNVELESGVEIPVADVVWNEEAPAWSTRKYEQSLGDQLKSEVGLSVVDKKMLKLLSNAATSTTTMGDVPNFQIRVRKNSIYYIEQAVNVEGSMSAQEIKQTTGLDVKSAADWMFAHGARKVKNRKRNYNRMLSIYD